MLRTIESGPAVSASDVHALERHYGISLPQVYRDFLVACNGGRPERDLFQVPGCKANPVARIHFFFGIDDPVKSCNLAWNMDAFEDRLPRGMIPIGTTEGADKICLDLGSGAVAYWDGYEDAVFPVAESLEDFMASLVSDDLSPSMPSTSPESLS